MDIPPLVPCAKPGMVALIMEAVRLNKANTLGAFLQPFVSMTARVSFPSILA